jgi:hypothetical protein
MKKAIVLLAVGVVSLSPAALIAGPGGHGGGIGHGAAMSQGAGMGRGAAANQSLSPTTTHTSQGPTNGVGWNHLKGPSHPTGQPGFECEDIRPGHASGAPGSAFNPDGNAGTRYAGEQPQNSRNTASVSQYDTACLHQPQH